MIYLIFAIIERSHTQSYNRFDYLKMKIVRPKILGTLQIKIAIAGNYIVENGINKPPNKIRIPCSKHEDALEIIDRLKTAKPSAIIHI